MINISYTVSQNNLLLAGENNSREELILNLL